MAVPEFRVRKNGEFATLSDDAKALLREYPGSYRGLRAGTLILLTPDEGTGAAPREAEHVALAGDLKAMPLLGLLNLLGQGRETGRLVVKQDRTERVMMLRDGDIASVGSNLPEDRLGRFLVKLGMVTESDLARALTEAQHQGNRFGQTLVSQGLVDAHELWNAIQEQITEIFTDVVQWNAGSFVLYRSDVPYVFPTTPPLSMQGLLLEAVRRADEMSVYRERIQSTRQKIRKLAGAFQPSKELTEIDKRALESFDGEIRIADLARRIHVTEFEATRAVYVMLKHKVVMLVDDALDDSSAPYKMTPEDRQQIDVYNLAFREVRDEVIRAGRLEPFMVGLIKYMSDTSAVHSTLFRGVHFEGNGELPCEKLASNIGKLGLPDPFGFAQDALKELTFFMLFQCGELLEKGADENLGRRVRLIHAALNGSASF